MACASLPPAQSVRTLARGDSLDLSGLQQESIAARKAWTPEAIAYADDGSLWVSDSHNHRILGVSPTGVIRVLTGDESAGNDNGDLDSARFDTPRGLHWDGKLLWVADTNNQSIRSIDPYLGVVKTAKVPAVLSTPLVLLKQNSYLWIAEASGKVWRWHTTNHKDMRLMMDFGPHRVIRQLAQDVDGEGVLLLDNLGLWHFNSLQDQPVLTPRLPYRENVPRLGGFWSSSTSLVVTTPFEDNLLQGGNPLSALSVDISALQPALRYPGLITGNAQGDLVVADVGSQSLYRLTPLSLDTSSVGSETTAMYQATVLAQSGTQGFGERRDKADLSLPHGLLYLPERKVLWVTDYYHHRILEINTAGQARPLFENQEPVLSFPTGLVRHPNGDIYIASSGNHQIYVYRAGELKVFAGSGKRGLKDGNTKESQFWLPWGMAFDPQGELYIADHGNHAIRRISPAGEVSTVAGNGQPGFVNAKGAQARFYHPVDLLFYGKQLVISDSWNNQLRAFNVSTSKVTTYAGRDEPGLQEGSRTKARFYCPSGLSDGPNGSLLIADAWNHRIRQMSRQGEVSTLAGEGRYYNWNSGEEDGEGVNSRFQQPRDMVYDPGTQQIFVADTANNSVRVITP